MAASLFLGAVRPKLVSLTRNWVPYAARSVTFPLPHSGFNGNHIHNNTSGVLKQLTPPSTTGVGRRGYGDIPGINALMEHAIKMANERAKKEDVKLLLSKPSHDLRKRSIEIDEIEATFEKLRKYQNNSVVSVFMLGAPACGKTQLARQYGESYYDTQSKNRQLISIDKKIVIVGTLDVRNESSLWRSYSRLAMDLHCEVKAVGKLKDRLAVLKVLIQKKCRENPGWLLIVDGVNEEMAREFEDYWPQPNIDDWGEGRVLVTTSSPEVAKKHDCNSFSLNYNCPRMREEDAVYLLQKMSNIYEKGAKDVVNTSYIDRNPLDIACAAIIIKEERSKDKKYSFHDFIRSREITDSDSEPKLEVPSSLSEAVKKLAATDDDLKLVLTAMGMCAHDPIPDSIMNRLLGKNIRSLPSITDCPLLLKIPEQSPPIDDYDKIPRIYAHYSTLNQFREELINSKKKDRGFQDLQRRLVKSVLDEYDEVSISETVQSKWIQQLLFRHLQRLLYYEDDKNHYLDPELKIRLAVTLSNAHIELNRNPEKSKIILTDLEKEFRSDSLSPYNQTKLNLSWAKVNRHLCQYESSAVCLSNALKGIDHVRDQLTASEATECLKECTALSLLYHSSDHDQRVNLEKAIRIYDDHVKEKLVKMTSVEAKCALSHLYLKMGEWSKGQEYLHEAKGLLDTTKSEEEIMNFSAYESLAFVHSEIGDHQQSIDILKMLIKQIRDSYCLNDKPSSILSIPYARLCSAHYYNGERDKAYDSIKSCMQCLDQMLKSKPRDTRASEQNEVTMRRTPYIPPWTSMHIITTLLCDFGDISYPMTSLIERIENTKFEDTPLLLGRLYRHRGLYPQAEKILEEHLRENDGLSKDSIRIGLIWAELGKVYREQGYIIRGLKSFEKAFNIYKQFYVDPNHPEVAFVQAELGRVIQLNGNKQLGIEMMEKAVDTCKKHMENKSCTSKKIYVSIKYAQMLSAFGIVLRYEYPPERMDEALKYLYEALELQDSTLDEKSINRIRTLYYIGSTLHKKGELDQAKEKMMESLRLIHEIGYCHPYEASICTGLGRLLQESDPEEAEKYMNRAFAIRENPEKFSSDAHWKVAFAFKNVGEIMQSRGLKVGAFQDFMKANNMFIRLIERESSEYEEWHDSRSSSAPDYGIDIIERWKKDQKRLFDEMRLLVDE